MVTVGHRDFFDINVPGFFLKFWYQCPTLVPAKGVIPISKNDHCLHRQLHTSLFFPNLSFVSTSWLKHSWHQHGRAAGGKDKGGAVPPDLEFDIKCPILCPRILISSHGDCPTVTKLSVCTIVTLCRHGRRSW